MGRMEHCKSGFVADRCFCLSCLWHPVTMKQSPATKSLSKGRSHAFHMRVPSLLCSLNHSSILFLSPMSSTASLGSKTMHLLTFEAMRLSRMSHENPMTCNTAHVAWPRYSGRCQGQLIWPHVGYVRIYTQIIAQILFHPTVHTPLLFSLPLGQIKVVTWPPACPSWRQQLDAIAKVVRKTWHAVRRVFKPGVRGERSLHGRPNSQFARLLAWATLQSDQAWSVETIEWVRHLRCLKTQKKGCRRIWFAIISLGEFDGVWALVLRNPYLVLQFCQDCFMLCFQVSRQWHIMTYRVPFSHEVHQIATCYDTTTESSYQVVMPGVWTCFKLVVHASHIHYQKKINLQCTQKVSKHLRLGQSGLDFKVTSQKHILLICIRNQPEKSFCIDFEILTVSKFLVHMVGVAWCSFYFKHV